MSVIILYRIDTPKRMHRYYRMDLQPDFGQWCLMCEWGRIGSTGQTRSVPLPYPERSRSCP
jgi:predicted DNA-binding WGR domain protein